MLGLAQRENRPGLCGIDRVAPRCRGDVSVETRIALAECDLAAVPCAIGTCGTIAILRERLRLASSVSRRCERDAGNCREHAGNDDWPHGRDGSPHAWGVYPGGRPDYSKLSAQSSAARRAL